MASKVIISPPSQTGPMDLYNAEEYPADEKHQLHHSHAHTHHHNSCHNARLRRFFVPILVLFLFISATLLFSYLPDIVNALGLDGTSQETALGSLGLWAKRATTDAAGTPNGSSSFTHRKLYLIVIFVGLLLVLIAGIMLSAWCCKGSFKNPLCCPCYLCACCGGLACLECISCGLCAGAAEEMF